MAGRLHIAPCDLAALLPNLVSETPLLTSANQAPRQPLSIIRRAHGQTQLVTAFWGLTPPWLKVLDHAPHCARADSLSSRPMFQEAFSARRCLIPATGIYIWKPQPRFKQPFLVTRIDRGPLLLAALWCRYHTTLTEYNDSTALITVASNTLLASLTDRLPAVIDRASAATWLDPATPDDEAGHLLTSAPRELLGAFPVSRRVNDPAHQDWACGHPTGPMLRWNIAKET